MTNSKGVLFSLSLLCAFFATLTAGAAAPQVSVCDRSQPVRLAIMAAVSDQLVSARKADQEFECDDVTQEQLEAIDSLQIHSTESERIWQNDFSGLNRLRYLDLADNKIKALPRGVFSGLEKLHTLDLSSNQLKDLDGVFGGTPVLQNLYLYNNQIEALSDVVFQDLPSLTVLVASANAIKFIHANAFEKNGDLTVLDLSDNSIINTNDVAGLHAGLFRNNGYLERVELGKNLIDTIPAGLFSKNVRLKAVELTTYRLNATEREGLRRAVRSQVPSLARVTLSNRERRGQFRPVGARSAAVRVAIEKAVGKNTGIDAGDLEDITELNLSGTRLDGIQVDDFAGLSGLEVLDLSHAQLTRLPDGIFRDLRSLKEVRLHGNLFDNWEQVSIVDLTREHHVSYTFSPAVQIKELTTPGICQRSAEVRQSIEIQLNAHGIYRDCADVTAADLAEVRLISLNRRDGKTFNWADFEGLVNVVELQLLNAYDNVDALFERHDGKGFLSQFPNLRTLSLRGTPLRAYKAKIGEFLASAGDRLEFVDLGRTGVIDNGRLQSIYSVAKEKGFDVRVASASGDEGVVTNGNRSELRAAAQRIQATGETFSLRVQAELKRVKNFVEGNWHLPLRFNVSFSRANDGIVLPARARAIEEKQIVRQIQALKEAYRKAAFDFFAVDLKVGDVEEPTVSLDPESLTLHISLPRVSRGGEGNVVTDSRILETLSSEFDWEKVGAWYRDSASGELSVSRALLNEALQRDFGKFRQIGHDLRVDLQRLDVIIALVTARAQAGTDKTSKRLIFSPSEVSEARLIQFRTLLSLQRVLNTLTRWKIARTDEDLTSRDAIRVLLAHGAQIYRVYLDWFLASVLHSESFKAAGDGGRSELYKLLDEATPAGFFHVNGYSSPEIPAGSVRHMLKSRIDGDFSDYLTELEQDEPEIQDAALEDSEFGREIKNARKLIRATRKLRNPARTVSDLRAWWDLWSANIGNTASYPIYTVVSKVATGIGKMKFNVSPTSISKRQIAEMETGLQPGDIILVRQDNNLSNAFLPGFWTHALMYLGQAGDVDNRADDAKWTNLRLPTGRRIGDVPELQDKIRRYKGADHDGPFRIIEAISSGVQFHSLEHAVAKDYVMVLRSNFDPAVREGRIAQAILTALTHEGKRYDFDFDFATDDKIVCSELVYRSYQGPIQFSLQINNPSSTKLAEERAPGLIEVMGRTTMPANEIARLGLYMASHPNPDPSINYLGQTMKIYRVYDKVDENGTESRMTEWADAEAAARRTIDN